MINSTKSNLSTPNTSIMASTLMQKLMFHNPSIKINQDSNTSYQNTSALLKKQKSKVKDDFYLENNHSSSKQIQDKKTLKLNIEYQVCQNPSQKKQIFTNMIKNSKLRPLKLMQPSPINFRQKNYENSLKRNKINFDNKQPNSQTLIEKSQTQNQQKAGNFLRVSNQMSSKQKTIQKSPKKVSVHFQLFFPRSKMKTTINQPKSHTRRSVNISSFEKDIFRIKKSSKSINTNQNKQHMMQIIQPQSLQTENQLIQNRQKQHQEFLISMGKNSAQKYIDKIEKFKKYKNNKMNKQLKFGLNVLPVEYHQLKNISSTKQKFVNHHHRVSQNQLQSELINSQIVQKSTQIFTKGNVSQGFSFSFHKLENTQETIQENPLSPTKNQNDIKSVEKKCPSQHKLLKKNLVNTLDLEKKKNLFKTKYQQMFSYQKGTFKVKIVNMLNSLDQLLNSYCCRISRIAPVYRQKAITNKNFVLQKSYLFQEQEKNILQISPKNIQKPLQKSQIMINSQGISLDLNNQISTGLKSNKDKFLYFIGNGNNRNLIRAIMKKRGWWMQTQNIDSANFVWTQLKMKQVLDREQKMSDKSIQQPDSWHYKKRDDINCFQLPKTVKNKANALQMQQFQNDIYQKVFHKNVLRMYYKKLTDKNKEYQYLRELTVPKIIHNHYDANYMLGNKKALFYNLTQYGVVKKINVHEFMPMTFHIEKTDSRQFKSFMKMSKKFKNALWIVKPGQNSNRGNGIFVQKSIQKIKLHVQNNSGKHSFIVQKYLKSIFLYNKRKFDIRVYMLMVTIGGITKFFWYEEGYIRTSSEIYNTADISDLFIHLTNDAIQNKNNTYSKYEKGNKVSFSEFQRYLDANHPNQKYSVQDLSQRMRNIAEIVVKSTYFKLDKSKKTNGFQLFGLDFLIDKNFSPWLLQVNTNPCLQLSSPVLQRLIPRMVQNMFRLSLDPVFRPNQNISKNDSYFVYDNVFQTNKFSLIFDSLFDSDFEWQQICNKDKNVEYQDDDEVFDNNGEQLQINQ